MSLRGMSKALLSLFGSLTLSYLLTSTDTSINSADPDEMKSHFFWIYTVCHFVIDFRLKPLFAVMVVS